MTRTSGRDGGGAYERSRSPRQSRHRSASVEYIEWDERHSHVIRCGRGGGGSARAKGKRKAVEPVEEEDEDEDDDEEASAVHASSGRATASPPPAGLCWPAPKRKKCC